MATLQEENHFSLTQKVVSAWSNVAVVVCRTRTKIQQWNNQRRHSHSRQELVQKQRFINAIDPVSTVSFKRKQTQKEAIDRHTQEQVEEDEEMLLLEATERGKNRLLFRNSQSLLSFS
jgi:hypothetical protein